MLILFYVSICFLLLVLILDLLFYVPITIHIFIYGSNIYIYLYTIPIIVFDSKRRINKLKNKISIEKLKNTKKEDLQIVKSFSIKEMVVHFNKSENIEKLIYIYPLIGIVDSFDETLKNNKLILSCNDKKKSHVYVNIRLQIVNIFIELIKIRRLKRERTSNKRNTKKFTSKYKFDN